MATEFSDEYFMKKALEEAKNANCYSVGIIMGSSELGLTKEEVLNLSEKELDKEKKRVRENYYKNPIEDAILMSRAVIPTKK